MRSETPTSSDPGTEDSSESDSTSSTSSSASSDSASEPDARLDAVSKSNNSGAIIDSGEPNVDVDDPSTRDDPVDPNEPDDDGEDLSDVQLSSGLTFDPETGLVLTGGEEVDAEDDSDGNDSEPESELEESEDDGGDEEY
ncbi:hypothetical protein B0H14DRAFT_2590784 [Mycena olivaceomarginata]|nr:hypothetical protein B0H14DRAFT_2590784 [Mycena olivaceomarginata]